jgi:hypothetical protein
MSAELEFPWYSLNLSLKRMPVAKDQPAAKDQRINAENADRFLRPRR